MAKEMRTSTKEISEVLVELEKHEIIWNNCAPVLVSGRLPLGVFLRSEILAQAKIPSVTVRKVLDYSVDTIGLMDDSQGYIPDNAEESEAEYLEEFQELQYDGEVEEVAEVSEEAAEVSEEGAEVSEEPAEDLPVYENSRTSRIEKKVHRAVPRIGFERRKNKSSSIQPHRPVLINFNSDVI